jgi:hypothetical protein
MWPHADLRRNKFKKPGARNKEATTTIVAPVGNCSVQLT